jgi:hypothetical protein
MVFLRSVRRVLVTASVVHSSPILVTLIMEWYVPPKRRFLQEPHGVTSQKTPFFNHIVGFPFWRSVGTFMNVAIWEHCTFDNQIFRRVKCIILTPLSL